MISFTSNKNQNYNHQLQLQPQPSTTKMNRKKKPSTGNRQASTVNNQQSTVSRQPSAAAGFSACAFRLSSPEGGKRSRAGGRDQRKDSHRRDATASLTGTSLCAYAIEPPCTEGYTSDCRQSYRQRREMHGESAERGRESPFCVQSMLIQEYF